MAINFPTSPVLNDEYTYGGRTWVWNGTAWKSVTSGDAGWQKGTGTGLSTSGKIYIGPASGTPDSPALNDIWIQTG